MGSLGLLVQYGNDDAKEGNELWRYVHDNSSTFEEFIYNCTDEVEIKSGVHYSFAYNQLDYVTDAHGNLLVDFIGRLKNLDNDLQEVFRRIGFELETVPHKNRSGHQHYSTFYTPDTELIVRERLKRDTSTSATTRKPEKTRSSLRLWLRQERDHGPRRLPEPAS